MTGSRSCAFRAIGGKPTLRKCVGWVNAGNAIPNRLCSSGCARRLSWVRQTLSLRRLPSRRVHPCQLFFAGSAGILAGPSRCGLEGRAPREDMPRRWGKGAPRGCCGGSLRYGARACWCSSCASIAWTPSGLSPFAAVSAGRHRVTPCIPAHPAPMRRRGGAAPRHALRHHATARTNRG